MLRDEHGFALGHGETHDALRAIELTGLTSRARTRTAMRLVCCASLEQTRVFDRVFDAFFDPAPPGLPQHAHAPRHTRPGREKPTAPEPRRSAARTDAPRDDGQDAAANTAAQRRAVGSASDDAARWQALRARYSPLATRGGGFELDPACAATLRPIAEALIRGVRLGRSRRWKASAEAGRFDLRRTVRASLATGGDPVALRFLGHPLRNPRFVVLIDGSRSMSGHTDVAVAFAAALCERTARADAFFFSTSLRDVTRELRAAARAGMPLNELGEAWGGGTKIGANLAHFVDMHGARLLTVETLVFIVSDGLDAGDVAQLERALREIDRRSAGIVWLNPHAATPGFVPATRAMQAALRSITLLAAAGDVAAWRALAKRILQTPRIRGRRC